MRSKQQQKSCCQECGPPKRPSFQSQMDSCAPVMCMLARIAVLYPSPAALYVWQQMQQSAISNQHAQQGTTMTTAVVPGRLGDQYNATVSSCCAGWQAQVLWFDLDACQPGLLRLRQLFEHSNSGHKLLSILHTHTCKSVHWVCSWHGQPVELSSAAVAPAADSHTDTHNTANQP